MNKEELKEHFHRNQEEIESRLREFHALRDAPDERLFKELSFVIFTSQSSAKDCWKAVNELDRKGLLKEPVSEQISEVLNNHGVQYAARKSDYIVRNYDFLSQPNLSDSSNKLKIKDRIKENDLEGTRGWFVNNVKGLSWKGSSHFMRNIGYGEDFAILSQHTVSALQDLGVIDRGRPPESKEEYLKLEEEIQAFSREIDIEVEALDLALWSYQTGEIFR